MQVIGVETQMEIYIKEVTKSQKIMKLSGNHEAQNCITLIMKS